MKKENLAVAIDTQNSLVKVMNIIGTDISTARVEYFPYDESLMTTANYNKIVGNALSSYFENKPAKQSLAVYLVLPDNLVAIDTLTVPSMKKSAVKDALIAQMKEFYHNYNELKINLAPLSYTKTNQTFQAIMVQKNILNDIYKVLAQHKLYIKDCTYASSSAINSVTKLYSKARKHNYIFMDMRAESTTFSICAGGNTIGSSSLPFGYNILKSTNICRETLLYDHDMAYLAVQNASERAKQTKLSMAVDPDEALKASEVVDENAIHANSLNADSPADTDERAMSNSAISDEDEYDEQKTPASSNLSVDNSAKISGKRLALSARKSFVRKIKRLPLYMQRPIPDSKEGLEYENFRIFLKKALLIKMFNDGNTTMPALDMLIINMPAEFRHVIARANEETNNEIEIVALELASDEKTAKIVENLDLYGALFTKYFNKNNNF